MKQKGRRREGPGEEFETDYIEEVQGCLCPPPPPPVTLTNARSLVNKMDHLQALVKYDGDYRRSNIICVTETWFSEEKFHNIDGYTSVRLDRSKKKSSKEKGGGLVMYVDKDWATNITVRETANTTDYEILHVSFRPHCLPREFTQVYVIHVLVLRTGPKQQRSRRPHSGPLFSTSWHVRPLRCPPTTYRQLVKREGPKTRIIRKWDHDTAETVRGCFEGTNWDIFYENEDGLDLDTITDSITSYICVCEENIVQTKRIKVYANSKP